MQQFYIPYPPSVNGLFFNKKKGGRVRTKEYDQWARAAGLMVLSQRSVFGPGIMVPGLVTVELYAVAPDKRKRDVENLSKAVGDLLVTMRVIEDDCKVMRSSQEWATGDRECLVVVREWNGEMRDISGGFLGQPTPSRKIR